jgi:hypothetical protein
VRRYTTQGKLDRGNLEGRLLAGQPFAAVAAACGLTEAAVEAYHALFLDVAGRLDADVYILDEAIGEKAWYGLQEDDIDLFLKLYGYLKGPLMLEALLRYYTSGWKVPERLDGLTRGQLEDLALMLRIRTIVLARVLPFERLGGMLLMDQMIRRLDAALDAWPKGGDCGLLADLCPDDRQRWWDAWRALVVIGSGRDGVPALQAA